MRAFLELGGKLGLRESQERSGSEFGVHCERRLCERSGSLRGNLGLLPSRERAGPEVGVHFGLG